jgi:DNA repair protein RadA/Sms
LSGAFLVEEKGAKKSRVPVALRDVVVGQDITFSTGISELDRVLGGGIVRGSATLLGGEPGIGKSTLSLQVAQHLSSTGLTVLYVSGEESVGQLHLRANRLGSLPPHLMVYAELDVLKIVQTIRSLQPDVVILDSIQVVYHSGVPSVAGSVNQVRQCAQDLISYCKDRDIALVLIGHITKEGQLAGPKVLEHIVDVILYLEGERDQHYRLLRCFKNRFSATSEIGIFEMKGQGLIGVSNPSGLFMDEQTLKSSGAVVSVLSEGSRALLVEVQALVVDSGYGMAKRTFLGVDLNRANLMIAALEKLLGFRLSSKDIILNIVGGIKVTEPALDLAMMLSIVSSFKDHSVGCKAGFFGEVGLTGEIRPVANADKRVLELEKMGFDVVMLPEKNRSSCVGRSVRPVFVSHVRDAVQLFLGGMGE